MTAQDATVHEVLTGRQNLVMIGRLSGLRRRQARARAAASLLWSVALLVIFAPLATLLYRRRTTG